MLGIMAPMKDYYFIWHVNRLTNYAFRAIPDATIPLFKKRMVNKREKEMVFYFNVFEYVVPLFSLRHYIYHNQSKGEPLLPDYKNIDFLWLMQGDYASNDECKYLAPLLKDIPGVQLVIDIDISSLKRKEDLVL